MKKVLYVTSRLPALTVTFIYKEIHRLQGMGRDVLCVSMNTPSPDEISADAGHLSDVTHYLDGVSFGRKTLACFAQLLRHPLRFGRCFWIALTASPMQGARDYTRLFYHLLEGGYLAWRYREQEIEHIHSHFINGPTSIAMFTAILRGVPFSFTMHASMIWLDPIAFKNKLAECKFCASISEYNKRYVVETYGEEFADKIHLVHCGIDPEMAALPARPGDADEIGLLGLGQLNARKGFHVLVEAMGLLKEELPKARCTIVGGGEEFEALSAAIEQHGVQHMVELVGPVPHEEVQGYLERCDVFVLPCVVSKDGWRDGIPVALMEAMFHRRPVVSTSILGIPELIESGQSGLLVESDNARQLATAVRQLAGDADSRRAMGERGREKVLAEFNNQRSVESLAELFDAA
ncbi:MAG: glycosyltransferase family 4 protein [Pseudomonadota bacterium]